MLYSESLQTPPLGTKRSRSLANFKERKEAHFGHSHNDFEQKRPLYDALEYHFYSVEADIWMVRDRILVSHWGLKFVGSLKELYLDPLEKRVREFRSVYGDDEKFLLWLDIKDPHPDLIPTLHTLLSQYSIFTQYHKDHIESRAVDVILTGNENQKKLYTDSYTSGFACRDTFYLEAFGIKDQKSLHRVCWVSFQWYDHLNWNGWGPVPSRDKRKLKKLVYKAQKFHRQVRIWGGPDTPNAWNLAYSSGVHLISTDMLENFFDLIEFESLF